MGADQRRNYRLIDSAILQQPFTSAYRFTQNLPNSCKGLFYHALISEISGKFASRSVRAGIRRDLIEYLVEFGAVEQPPIEHHSRNLARVLDIFQRIRIEQHEIGQLTFFNGSHLALQSKKF